MIIYDSEFLRFKVLLPTNQSYHCSSGYSTESKIGIWAMGSILDNSAGFYAHFAATESETKNSYSLGHHLTTTFIPPRLEASYSCMTAVVDHLRVHKSYFESFSFQSALGQPSQESSQYQCQISNSFIQQLKIM